MGALVGIASALLLIVAVYRGVDIFLGIVNR